MLSAPAAEARCPRAATGTFSGLFTLVSFNASVGHTDSSTGLARITLAADGTFSGEFDPRGGLVIDHGRKDASEEGQQTAGRGPIVG